MNIRRHANARRNLQQQCIAARQRDQYYSDYMHAQAALDDDWDGEYEPRDTICRHCSGTGGDPWNDGITPCEHCDGEGYEWWQ